jgi:hypothetical protein
MFRLSTWLFKYIHYIFKDQLYIQISIEAWKMFWMFHTWNEGYVGLQWSIWIINARGHEMDTWHV